MKTKKNLLLLSALSFAFSQIPAHADDLEQRLLRCSVLGDPSARLGCFDSLSKVVDVAMVKSDTNPATNASTPIALPPVDLKARGAMPESQISRTQQQWELNANAKRGRFALRPHNDNYLLLANYSAPPNDKPFQEAKPGGEPAKRVELSYQLSVKMKAMENVAGTPVDLWLGYTQQSFWQAYNRAASSPFRETNYQPEAIAVIPLNKKLGGVEFSYLNFGLVHQSNGQTTPLSRSWNRVYSELGVDYGDLAMAFKIWHRLDNAKSENDNPDIIDYLGHGEARFVYRAKGHEYYVMARRNFNTKRGALEVGWSFPLVMSLKGYLHAFGGYGQSLIDYNYSQQSIGIGVMMDF